jgi:hypothetical protein
MKKRKLFNLTLVAFTLAALSFKPSVYADCDLEHCGNENLAPTDHHELVLGILIGIGITLVVLLCIMALTKIRKKTTSR